MPAIKYKDLDKYFKDLNKETGKDSFAPIYLIFGEEFLCKRAFKAILNHVLPKSQISLNYEPVDGKKEEIHRALEKVKTYPFLSNKKVVSFTDAQIFSFAGGSDTTKSEKKKEAEIFKAAVEKGFPKGNHLLITAETADKRLALYKIINKKGMTIDCGVPIGDKFSDKKAQQAVLHERMEEILNETRKTMDHSAFLALYEKTGFALRTFSGSLEKLTQYVGARDRITVQDVETLLKRTKKDPLWELTEAIGSRNINGALFFLNSLLSDNVHPLQILTAIVNQIRKILIVKDFTLSQHGKVWNPGCSYDQFKNRVLQAIKVFDDQLLNELKKWDSIMPHIDGTSGGDDDTTGSKKKDKKKTAKTDLLIAKNPNNPYPIYQMLKKSEAFSKDNLIDILKLASTADMKLKKTGQKPKAVLEWFIFGGLLYEKN